MIQAAGDKGRDLLVHQDGVLTRVIQCKNLLAKVGRPDLLLELVKLVLFDEIESFLPSSEIRYELLGPTGILPTRFQAAESLLKRLQSKRGTDFTHRQKYRVTSNLGAALFRLGRPEEAADFFLEAGALEPDDVRASTNEVFAHF